MPQNPQKPLARALQITTLLTAILTIGYARIPDIGWEWAGVIWIYNAVTYMPMDMFKLAIRYALSGKAWGTLLEHKIAFTAKKDCMREEQEAQWVHDGAA